MSKKPLLFDDSGWLNVMYIIFGRVLKCMSPEIPPPKKNHETGWFQKGTFFFGSWIVRHPHLAMICYEHFSLEWYHSLGPTALPRSKRLLARSRSADGIRDDKLPSNTYNNYNKPLWGSLFTDQDNVTRLVNIAQVSLKNVLILEMPLCL